MTLLRVIPNCAHFEPGESLPHWQTVFLKKSFRITWRKH
jgi:hypothetical protein